MEIKLKVGQKYRANWDGSTCVIKGIENDTVIYECLGYKNKNCNTYGDGYYRDTVNVFEKEFKLIS